MLCLLWEGFLNIDLPSIRIQVMERTQESPLVLLIHLYASIPGEVQTT
jgi:hypothetical protein